MMSAVVTTRRAAGDLDAARARRARLRFALLAASPRVCIAAVRERVSRCGDPRRIAQCHNVWHRVVPPGAPCSEDSDCAPAPGRQTACELQRCTSVPAPAPFAYWVRGLGAPCSEPALCASNTCNGRCLSSSYWDGTTCEWWYVARCSDRPNASSPSQRCWHSGVAREVFRQACGIRPCRAPSRFAPVGMRRPSVDRSKFSAPSEFRRFRTGPRCVAS